MMTVFPLLYSEAWQMLDFDESLIDSADIFFNMGGKSRGFQIISRNINISCVLVIFVYNFKITCFPLAS